MKKESNDNWLGLGVGIFLGGCFALVINGLLEQDTIDSFVTMFSMLIGGFLGKKYLKKPRNN